MPDLSQAQTGSKVEASADKEASPRQNPVRSKNPTEKWQEQKLGAFGRPDPRISSLVDASTRKGKPVDPTAGGNCKVAGRRRGTFLTTNSLLSVSIWLHHRRHPRRTKRSHGREKGGSGNRDAVTFSQHTKSCSGDGASLRRGEPPFVPERPKEKKKGTIAFVYALRRLNP